MIMGLNFPIENIFGFKNDHLMGVEGNPAWYQAFKKLNEMKQKLNSQAVILPSPLTGMIMIMQANEKQVAEMAKSVNAKHTYDSLTRIGYLDDFKTNQTS